MSNNQIIINNIRRIIRLKGVKQCVIAEKAGFTPKLSIKAVKYRQKRSLDANAYAYNKNN